MEKHYLLLLLSLSLLLGFLQALSCFYCELLNSEGICEKGESTCETDGDQQCSMVEVSTGPRIQYMIQECSNLCFNRTFTEKYITVKYTCCNNTSFCNQP
ncbi:prostate and testis expressed protein 14 [Phodopus roborovskii]|uniref:LOC100359968 protein n=1 Tax=Phodopus roborovskii TaxID=109678 RepID=A0AAU9ZS39_PHORO|nr:prostate and testis expressed protein 14 [Phodopus roborovskii]CAH6860421.1 LOC100359968 [Phodopus roborovskii]